MQKETDPKTGEKVSVPAAFVIVHWVIVVSMLNYMPTL